MAKLSNKVSEDNTNKTNINKTNTKNAKKNNGMVKTVQEIMPFVQAFDNGVFQIDEKNFSKVYKISDMNFVVEPEDKQDEILLEYQKLINKFPENVTLSLVIHNKVNNDIDLSKAFHIQERGDKFDRLRAEYNQIIDEKIKEGRNDIQKDKYLILNIYAPDYNTAEGLFVTLETELTDKLNTLTKQNPIALSLYERVKLLNLINNGNNANLSFDKQFVKYIVNNSIDADKVENGFDLKSLKRSGVTLKDMIAPEVIIKDKNHLRIGEDRYVKTLSFNDLPKSLDVKFLTELTNVPCEMVTTVTFNPVPKKKAIQLIKYQAVSIKADLQKQAKKALQNNIPIEYALDEDLQLAKDESQVLRNDVFNEGKKIFYVNITSTIFAESENELLSLVDTLKLKCEDYALRPNTLLGQQIVGYQSAQFLGKCLVRYADRMLTSESCCAMFPFNIQEIQDKRGHFYGINSISKNMIMFDRKNSQLANGLIFGQSGSGKSFITKGEVIPNLLDGEDDMIILDPENEYRAVADDYDGVVIDLKPKSEYHINPCDLDLEWDEPDASPLVEKCDFMVGLVESIMGKGRECNAFEVNAIHRATNRMYEPYIRAMEEKREKSGGKCSSIDTSLCPTLKDFYEELIADNSPEGNKVASQIEAYCVGNYNLFAHKTNVDTASRLVVYNLLLLPDKMREVAMMVCLTSIWNRIVKNRENNEKYGTKKAIWVYLDEFHLFLQSESTANTIKAYYKRVRKYNGIMTGITQDVSDLTSTSQGASMFDNTGFFIFLKQSPRGRAKLQELYQFSDALLDNLKDKPSGIGLVYNGLSVVPLNYRIGKDTEIYRTMSTNPNDKKYVSKSTDVKTVDVALDNNDTNDVEPVSETNTLESEVVDTLMQESQIVDVPTVSEANDDFDVNTNQADDFDMFD